MVGLGLGYTREPALPCYLPELTRSDSLTLDCHLDATVETRPLSSADRWVLVKV